MACLVVLLGAALLTGCDSDKTKLYVYNWGDYMDRSVIKQFEQENPDIKVVYEEFASNEDMYVKVTAGASNYDVAFPSDYMVRRLANEGLLHELNMDNIPNFQYIDSRFTDMGYDPGNRYSIPYTWGTVGIAYNTTMVDEPVDSWGILWDEKYEKNLFMYDSQRDSIAVALLYLGYSLNSTDEKELEEARDLLIAQRPLVSSYVGDEVRDLMAAQEAALAVVYNGDAMQMYDLNPDIEYVIPKEGSNIWFDCMVVPTTSQHKEEAERFIDFMCRPDIALQNTEWLCYPSPHTQVMEELDEEYRNNPTLYPDDEALARCEEFDDLSAVLPLYNRIWDEVKVGALEE